MTQPMLAPRYLASFQPRHVVHRFTDVLVLGSGLAGLRAALSVDPALSVLVVTKEKAQKSNSNWAQGGIAAVWTPNDCFEAHAADTVAAGGGLCDPDVVDLVVREAPLRVRELIDWGAVFDQTNGDISLTREGGHSFSRILHAMGDATGKEVIRAILAQVRARPNIRLLEDTYSVDLLTTPAEDGPTCIGVLAWSDVVGPQAIWAQQTILATGGCGQLWRETTHPSVATGDGLARAFRAGAELQDMEFMQFHPTVLYVAGSARVLISEAARGEG
ncbi:MAG: FAD-binding protein, partial [Planctomycetia bacterium]